MRKSNSGEICGERLSSPNGLLAVSPVAVFCVVVTARITDGRTVPPLAAVGGGGEVSDNVIRLLHGLLVAVGVLLMVAGLVSKKYGASGVGLIVAAVNVQQLGSMRKT